MEIISTTNVETQEQLLDALREAGFNSTQATVSRDIKELRIVKELTSFGTYRYSTAAREVPGAFSGRREFFAQTGFLSGLPRFFRNILRKKWK